MPDKTPSDADATLRATVHRTSQTTTPLTSSERRLIVRAIALGSVFILLLLGLNAIKGVLAERARLKEQAVEEIIASWGAPQSIVGPLIHLPIIRNEHTPQIRNINGRKTEGVHYERARRSLWFAPKDLDTQVQLATETRSRGIFDAVVYGAQTDIHASFDLSSVHLEDYETILWEESELVLALDDVRSLRAQPKLKINGESRPLKSIGQRLEGAHALGTPLELSETNHEQKIEVSLSFASQGAESFFTTPVGDDSKLHISGDWPHPSFQGNPLPVSREVRSEGFRADWLLTEFARGFSNPFLATPETPLCFAQLKENRVGLELLQPVDAYRVSERAIKYGILFIALVFAVFLLIEILARLALHPVQYFLVGAALVLFFLTFLALSEFFSSTLSYALAAAASVALVTFYTRTILASKKRGWAIFVGLSTIYVYLFFVLRSESYALLAGSLLLFGCLATIMITTRRIHWDSLGRDPTRIGVEECLQDLRRSEG